MGKKGGWFSAVKKAFAPESKDKKDQVLISIDFCFRKCSSKILD